MSETIAPLNIKHRRLIFLGLLLIFILMLPVFIFYATGYRFQFGMDLSTITPTGGLYVFTDIPDSVILLNDVAVQGSRLFRRASYIQAVPPGVQRVVVQAPGYDTWVKEVMVYPHLVVEIEAFNVPAVPQLRPVTQFLGTSSKPVIIGDEAAWRKHFAVASITVPVIFSTSTATSSWQTNPEYVLIESLFRDKASTTELIRLFHETEPEPAFGFAGQETGPAIDMAKLSSIPTSTISNLAVEVFRRGSEIVVRALQEPRERSHFFCARPYLTSRDLQVSNINGEELALTTEPAAVECRYEIVMDRQGREVRDFAFYPRNQNLLLLLREDALVVTEIDDRGWQNTQVLYQAEDLEFIIYRGSIFLKTKHGYFELLLEIARR